MKGFWEVEMLNSHYVKRGLFYKLEEVKYAKSVTKMEYVKEDMYPLIPKKITGEPINKKLK